MTELAGWERLYSGKVRDLYTSPEHPELVLMVASDRVSAFDHVLEPSIPGKGAMLTELSRWWFTELDSVPNHLAPESDWAAVPPEVADRSLLVTRLSMFPIECVVRGYLSGSGWVEYQQTQSVCGVGLPAGLSDGDRLPRAIFTPAWKAPLGEHDENITLERTAELVGLDNANALRDLSIAIFERAAAIAESRGIILADTKFEFGSNAAGEITLADEVLTSDSSRYWDAAVYASGDRTASFDKQIVRNWLKGNWSGDGEPPALPQDIVDQTAARYRELVDRLTS